MTDTPNILVTTPHTPPKNAAKAIQVWHQLITKAYAT